MIIRYNKKFFAYVRLRVSNYDARRKVKILEMIHNC